MCALVIASLIVISPFPIALQDRIVPTEELTVHGNERRERGD